MLNGEFFCNPSILKNQVDVVRDMTKVRKIGILVFPDVEVIDLCGPLDAFVYADRYLRMTGREKEPGYEVLVIAAARGLVKSKCGLQVMATHSCDEVTAGLDTLIVAGGEGIEGACTDPTTVKWLQRMAPRSRRVASVCTGAFLLATAGLLNYRRVTTHWMYCDALAAAFPSLRVDANRIFVRDGNVYTSGGITAGIDMVLSLIEEDVGRDIPRLVAGTMVVFLRRPGGQTQFSPFLQAEAKSRRDIRELQAWIVANPMEDFKVERLADRVAMSPRNFARLFQYETGMTPAKFAEHARTEAARCKLEQTALPVETIAEACGFGTANRMRRSFQRLLNVAPHDYRERFQSTSIK
jgi:transcriptional regulator GlxA family with amidase domain